jgi:hypothetical protein
VQARAYRELGQWRAALDARDEQIQLRTQLDQHAARTGAHTARRSLAQRRFNHKTFIASQRGVPQQRLEVIDCQ